ncbi:MAG: hypothetical protein R2712_13825 [Vicinamibacterales bacterium]
MPSAAAPRTAERGQELAQAPRPVDDDADVAGPRYRGCGCGGGDGAAHVEHLDRLVRSPVRQQHRRTDVGQPRAPVGGHEVIGHPAQEVVVAIQPPRVVQVRVGVAERPHDAFRAVRSTSGLRVIGASPGSAE